MIKYYTKEFSKSLHESIADWLNSFESDRNGRATCEYGFNIIDKSITNDDHIVITIEVWNWAGPLKECYFCGKKETKYHEFPGVYIMKEEVCDKCRSLDSKTLLDIKNKKNDVI